VNERFLPDTIGLTVEEALEALRSAGAKEIELVRTEPPNHPHKGKRLATRGKGKTDAVRVIAQRIDGDKIKLIVSAEAYVQPYKRIGGNSDGAKESSQTDVRR